MKRSTVAATQAAREGMARGDGRSDSTAINAETNAAAALRTADEDDWNQLLGLLIHDVARLRRNVFNEVMKPLGVTRSQWGVLAHLSRHDGMTQSDLAKGLDLGKAALGGLIERLEAAGLIERRADERDRRVKRIYLVSTGSRLVSRLRRASDEVSERILDGLAQDDRRALADMLKRVKSNLLSLRDEW